MESCQGRPCTWEYWRRQWKWRGSVSDGDSSWGSAPQLLHGQKSVRNVCVNNQEAICISQRQKGKAQGHNDSSDHRVSKARPSRTDVTDVDRERIPELLSLALSCLKTSAQSPGQKL